MEVLLVPADADQPDDAEVVRKTATLPGERERLLREAEVLKVAAERGVPGLPALVTCPSADVVEPFMVTRAVAGPSLAVAPPLPVLEVAGVAAEVARLLSGLHGAGLVHGAVEPGHVVLDGTGGVILVGLGDGGHAGGLSLDPDVGALDPAADVAGWGALVSHLLDWSATGDDEPLVALRGTLATRRVRRGGRNPASHRPGGDERRVLAALADQAQDPDPARRPAARSLAAAVAHRLPDARIPGAVPPAPLPSGPSGGMLARLAAHASSPPVPPAAGPATEAPPDGAVPHLGPDPPRRRRAAAARKPARLSLPAPAAGRLQPSGHADEMCADPPPPDPGGSPGPDRAPPERARPAQPSRRRAAAVGRPVVRPRLLASVVRRRHVVVGAVAAATLLGVPGAVARLRTSEPARPGGGPHLAAAGCPVASQPAADVDGDGCEEPVRWADGVLRAGVTRFALGGPGDSWAVGDWDCDGRRTPALLRDGTLAVFDTWPGPGRELQGRQVSSETGATGIGVVVGSGGCERPSLTRPGAPDLVVDARTAP